MKINAGRQSEREEEEAKHSGRSGCSPGTT
jgi:hypothetical protein